MLAGIVLALVGALVLIGVGVGAGVVSCSLVFMDFSKLKSAKVKVLALRMKLGISMAMVIMIKSTRNLYSLFFCRGLMSIIIVCPYLESERERVTHQVS